MFANPNQDETNEKIETMLSIGVVQSVDLANALAVVEIGEVETPPIEWITHAGAFKSFIPPSVGEQVLVVSLNGDLHNSVILGGIFSSANPRPLGDGQIIKYAGMQIKINETGTIELTAPQTNLIGDLNITGNLNVTGTITASDDVIGGGKSLKSHRHINVKSGGEVSGTPQ